MASKDYENKLCEAIEYIVDKAIAQAGYDKTIQATIVEQIDKTIGKYKIRYQDSTFIAYSESADKNYSKGTLVYVLIPGNDTSQHKTILGSTDKLGVNYISNPEGEDIFDKVGTNCIESDKEIELCTYQPDSIIELYDREKGIDEININQSEEKLNIYLKQSSALFVGATCRTDIKPEEQRRGTYGIVYELVFQDNNNSKKEIIRNYTFNTNQMSGQPLNYTLENRQYSIYELDGKNFIRINRIYAYQQNFPMKDNNKDNDIFIKNLELYGCNALTSEQLAGCALTITAPQGGFFDKNKPQDTLKLQANLRVKGQFIDKNSQDVKYYWFVEDARVDSSKKEYNQYGGFGWRCLNDFNSISNIDQDNESREWVAASYQYTINRDPDALAKINKFKCVAIYGDTIVSGVIDIYNRNSNYEFSIDIDTLDKNTTFYFDIGTPTITCLVNGEEKIDEYEYHWVQIDSKNNSTYLPNSDTDNITYNQKYSRYQELKDLIQREPEKEQANKEEMQELLTDLEKYDIIMRVENNKIHKIQISKINLFNTFKCGISKDGKYLGTASIVLSNIYELEAGYSLIMNNATQVFKYDANGITPMSKGLENSTEQSILPLSYTLYDAQGNDITNEVKEKLEIEWILPNQNTMLIFPDFESEEQKKIQEEHGTNWEIIWEETKKTLPYLTFKSKEDLSFNIADKYNISYNNNIVQLKLRFRELFFTVNSSFTFAKDGEPGTNGTDFVCKIVPYGQGELPFYPMVITKTDNSVRHNYIPEEDTTDDNNTDYRRWFKVQLWHSGVKIYEGYSNGISSENFEVSKVKWEVLKNNYGTVKENNENVNIVEYSDIDIHDSSDGSLLVKPYLTSENEENKANILKCSLVYKDVSYYATMPLITAKLKDDKYNIKLKENTGFLHAVYSTDGKKPQYNSANPFELVVTKEIGKYVENVTYATSADEKLEYIWSYRGHVYRFSNAANQEGDWEESCFLEMVNKKDEERNTNPKEFKPKDFYDGECVTNAIVCVVKKVWNAEEIARIHIPVHLLLNKYGQSALNDWDGNSISIDEDHGYILSPQMGAGEKNNDNSFSGVLMGKVREGGKTIEEKGLFGYSKGIRTFHLNSDNGAAIFGKTKVNTITEEKDGKFETNISLGGQIIIDPSSDKALLYSSNFFKNYKEDGMPVTDYTYNKETHKFNGQSYTGKNANDTIEAGALIDLSTPRILWGNGNFRVEPNGFIYAKGGGQIAGWNINDSRIDSTDKSAVKDVINEVKIGKTGMSSVYQDKDGNFPAGAAKWDVQVPKSFNTEGTLAKAMAFWAGGTGTNGKFYVSHDGYLRVQEATIGSGSKKYLIYIGKSVSNNHSSIYTFNKPELHGDGNGFYIGTDGIGLGTLTLYEKQIINSSTNVAETISLGKHSTFEVHDDGTLYAKNGYFNGEVYSTMGTIGGWYITSNGLQKLRKNEKSPFVTFGRTSYDGNPSNGRVLEVKDADGKVRLYIDETGKLGGVGVNLGGNIDISSGSIVIENGNKIFKVDGSTSKMTSNTFEISNGVVRTSTIYGTTIGGNGNGEPCTIIKPSITNGTMNGTTLKDVVITSTSVGSSPRTTFLGKIDHGSRIGSLILYDDGTGKGFKHGSCDFFFSNSGKSRIWSIPRIYSGGYDPNTATISNAQDGDIFIRV